jgi:hypothetical protein
MPNKRRLAGRRIAALAADGFEKLELTVPMRALQLVLLLLRRLPLGGSCLHRRALVGAEAALCALLGPNHGPIVNAVAGASYLGDIGASGAAERTGMTVKRAAGEPSRSAR